LRGLRWRAREIQNMCLGRIVETADARELYTSPLHPYAEALLSAVPIADPKAKRLRIRLTSEIPGSIHPPRLPFEDLERRAAKMCVLADGRMRGKSPIRFCGSPQMKRLT
jgi:oligopeptide/dipeptide ABC transporter ATP-binding protein